MKRLLPYVVPLLAFAALACFEQDYLWTAQEQNLFLHTPLFFRQCMATSGGLLSWAGAYLTQFFYYPLLGAGMLCLLWAFLMWLLKQTFRIPDSRMWLTIIPVSMLLAADVELGYWIYFLKLRGHLFVPTLGLLVVALLVWACRSLPRFRLPMIILTAFIGYPLFGCYGLLAAFLMAVMAVSVGTDLVSVRSCRSNFFRWRTDTRSVPTSGEEGRCGGEEDRRAAKVSLGMLVRVLVALACMVAVPLVCYHTLYHQTPFSYIYITALPIFNHNGVGDYWLYLPYVLIVLCLLLLAVGTDLVSVRSRTSDLSCQRTDIRVWAVRACGLLALILCAVLWNKDANFHRQLTMARQMERQDWNGMLATIGGAKDEPTRALSMMKNLALQRLGRLGKEMNRYPDGFARPDVPFPVHVVHTVGKMLYLQYGIPNYCYRWCMEDGVEYGWRAEQLKLMVKCSLLNGEPVAAQRYLSLLKKTDFHRQWARHYEAYLRQPSLMAKDPEFQAIHPLLRDDNFLTSDQSQLEPFLIEHLASAPGNTPQQVELRNIYFKLYLNRIRYAEQ